MNLLLVLSSVFSIVFIYIIMNNAQRLGLVDIPNHRSSHRKAVPKGAGIGFTLAAFLALGIFYPQLFLDHVWSFGAVLLVLVTGIVDDIINARPRLKFITILIATLMLYMDGLVVTSLGQYFGYEILLPGLIVLPFTYFAVVGFTNALNLIDGIDGLAGGVSLVILCTLLAIGLKFEDLFIVATAAAFSLALISFLLFNWNPAKVFMGDSGSLTLGFVIAMLSIKALEYINPTIVLFVAALPLLDTLSVMRRRRQRGQSLFKADKNHLHHILQNQKRDVKFTATMLILIQMVFSIIGYRSIGQDDVWNVILFGILFVIFFNLFDPRMRRRKKKVKQQKTHPLHEAMRDENIPAA